MGSLRPVAFLVCASALLALTSSSTAEIDPPSPGYALIQNKLTLVDGSCLGNVSVRYTFLSVDTGWAVRFHPNATCAIQPSIVEYEEDEPFAYRLGGGSTMGAAMKLNLETGMSGIEVSWPITQCPEITAWVRSYGVERTYTGCEGWRELEAGNPRWFVSRSTAYVDGQLECTVWNNWVGPDAGCIFSESLTTDVTWLTEDGEGLPSIQPGNVLLQEIHV